MPKHSVSKVKNNYLLKYYNKFCKENKIIKVQ